MRCISQAAWPTDNPGESSACLEENGLLGRQFSSLITLKDEMGSTTTQPTQLGKRQGSSLLIQAHLLSLWTAAPFISAQLAKGGQPIPSPEEGGLSMPNTGGEDVPQYSTVYMLKRFPMLTGNLAVLTAPFALLPLPLMSPLLMKDSAVKTLLTMLLMKRTMSNLRVLFRQSQTRHSFILAVIRAGKMSNSAPFLTVFFALQLLWRRASSTEY